MRPSSVPLIALLAAGLFAGAAFPAAAQAPDAIARPMMASADAASAQGGEAFGRQDWAEAARLYRLAWTADRKAAGFVSSRAAVDAFNLALSLSYGGETQAAAEVRERAIADRSRDPGGGGIELADLWRLEGLARVLDPARSSVAWRHAYDLYRAAPGQPALTAEAAGQLGESLGYLNRPDEAMAFAEEAVALTAALPGAAAPDMATALLRRGRIRGAAGDVVGAEVDVRAGLALQSLPEAFALDLLGDVLGRQGRYDEAAAALTQAAAGWDAFGPVARGTMAATIAQIGWMRLEQDRLDESEALFRQSMAVATAAGDATQTAYASAGLGWNLHLQRRYAEAEPLLRQAVLDISGMEGAQTHSTAVAMTNLAGDLQAQGRHREALTEFRRAYAAYVETLGPDHPDLGWTLNAMARSAAVEEPASADALFRQGLDKAALLAPGHPEASERAGDYSRYLISHGRQDEALTLLRAARRAALDRPGAARGPGPQHRSERVRSLFRLQVEAAWLNAGG